MNDLEIMKSYCDKCKHKGTCHMICPTVWFAVLQKERTERRTVLGSETSMRTAKKGGTR